MNDAFRVAPWADIHYACDGRWWETHGDEVKKNGHGAPFIQVNHQQKENDKLHYDAAKRFGLNIIYGTSGTGLGREVIHYGNNSGYQAINLAYLKGAATIILLGFDMQHTGGKVHFFGDHPKHLANGPAFNSILPLFNKLAEDLESAGVEVINCTRKTALTCFKRQDLETVLQSLSAQGQALSLSA